MYQSIFKAKVSFLPCVDADDTDLTTMTLAKALLSDEWRAKVEAVRAETDPVRKALLKSGLPSKPTQAQRYAVRAEKDPQTREQLRNGLPCFLPSGTFERATDTGLLEHSGFISIDLDAKDNPDTADFARLKEKVSAVPCVAYCGQSCRGAGYVLIIPIADPARHREHFKALQADFETCGLIIDPSGINVSRKRFVSYDPDPYINTGAKVYTYTMPERAERPAVVRTQPDDATTAKLETITQEIEAQQMDITGSYWDWVRVLSALANYLGEDGRDYAHRLSRFYSGYDYAATDAKFSNLLQHPEYSIKIGTLFYIARQELGKHDFDNLDA